MYISQNLALNTKSKYEMGFDHEQHKRNENIITIILTNIKKELWWLMIW